MSRYIDADAYADELWKMRQNYQMLDDTHTADKIMHGIFRAEQTLKEQPTVDAVPVVRCGKCKYFVKNTWECVRLADRFGDEYSDARVYPEYYCADGERKDGERDGRTD